MAVFSQVISKWALQSFLILHKYCEETETPWVRTRLWLWVSRKVWVPLCLKHATFGRFFISLVAFVFMYFIIFDSLYFLFTFFSCERAEFVSLVLCFLLFLHGPHTDAHARTHAHIPTRFAQSWKIPPIDLKDVRFHWHWTYLFFCSSIGQKTSLYKREVNFF